MKVFVGFIWGAGTVAAWFLSFVVALDFLVLAILSSIAAIILGIMHIYDEWL